MPRPPDHDPLDVLAALDEPYVPQGSPLQIPLDLIDEDPEQPRRSFDAESLEELAETIRVRGVRQPISVRHHPREPGRWVVNFGARRLRASRMAGRAQIPAFIDTSAEPLDQVIENEQREGLKPLELAQFLGQCLARGMTQAEVAQRLGKSRGFVSMVCALADCSPWLRALHERGGCSTLRELYDLGRLHGRHGVALERLVCNVDAPLGRSEVEALRRELEALPLGGVVPETTDSQGGAVEGRHELLPQPLVDGLRERDRGPVPHPVPAAVADSDSAAVAPADVVEGDATVGRARRQWQLRADWGGQTVWVYLTPLPRQPGHIHVVGIGCATPPTVDVSELVGLRLVGPGAIWSRRDRNTCDGGIE